MILTRTPFRISFFGGGTDLPEWYKKYNGEVLSTSIDKYCYISARFLPSFFQNKFRIVYSRVEEKNSINDIEHPVVKALMAKMKITDGIELHHFSDLPARSGVGSSSSFSVGVINALNSLYAQEKTKRELSMDAIDLEQNILKESVGSQDQIAVSYGGFNHIYFHKDGKFDIEQVKISQERLNTLKDNLLLFYTGITRLSSKIQKTQIKKIPQNIDKLKAIQSLTKIGLEILTNEKRIIDDFGYLLGESWKIKESLTDEISSDYIKNVYSEMLARGALGGKVLGAGGGGFMIFYANPENHEVLIRASKKFNLIHVPFNFEDSGSKIIYQQE